MKSKNAFIYTLTISLMLSLAGCGCKTNTVETTEENTTNKTVTAQKPVETQTHETPTAAATDISDANKRKELYLLTEKKNISIYVKSISNENNNIKVVLSIKNENPFDIWFTSRYDVPSNVTDYFSIDLKDDKKDNILSSKTMLPNEKRIYIQSNGETELTFAGSYRGEYKKAEYVWFTYGFSFETSAPNSFYEGEKTINGQVTTSCGWNAGSPYIKYDEISHLFN